MLKLKTMAACMLALLIPTIAFAAESAAGPLMLTTSWVGYIALFIFALAYLLVVLEEFTHLRKSKPVILAAGIIWAIVAFVYAQQGINDAAEHAIKEFMVDFGELFLFLLAAMTYVNSMSERNVFDALRSVLVSKGLSFRKLFWITGFLAFFLSPVIDNLTTALVMCAVTMAVGQGNVRFITLACINIVVGANAGGAYSPFGDITTLMVWQEGLVSFTTFFALFVPALVNYLIPAFVMQFAIPNEAPPPLSEPIRMKRGAKTIMFLFVCTIATAVSFHNFLHIPPFLGMMTGLGFLKIFGYYLKMTHKPTGQESTTYGQVGDVAAFDSFKQVAGAEWDTLLFFFGVIMCVGALGFIGYLNLASHWMYLDLGPTVANSLIGVLSSVVDNIPVMVAVLQMNPDMDVQQWLLVTLTAGVGGSMLSIGSAAGVALMGQARGMYTFFGHLKWTPIIAIGYVVSIYVHLWINGSYAGHMP